MKRSISKSLEAPLAALVLAVFALNPVAEAARGGGGGSGGGGGGGARASGGGGGGGGARQVDSSMADARSNNVRSTSANSVNNTNVNRSSTTVNRNTNVNVNVDNNNCCNGGWDNDYHPVARGVAVGTAVAVTAAVVGSMVQTVPPGCVPVNYGGMVYQQCGATWYQPQGPQFVVVNPPY